MQNIEKINDEFATHSDVWKRIFNKEELKGSGIKTGIESGWFLRHWALRKAKTNFNSDFQKSCYLSASEVREINSKICEFSEELLISERIVLDKIGADCKQKIEHFKVLAFLNRNRLQEPYVEFIEANDLLSNFATARAFIYARWICNLSRMKVSKKSPRVLEIGAGSASTLIMLSLMTDIKCFTIVDLPEMLPFAAYWIDEIHGKDADISFYGEESISSERRISFTLLTPDQIKNLDDESVDLILNINSFMEMDSKTLDFYFDNVYRIAAKKSLFININRSQPTLEDSNGEGFFNHPMYYPYKNDHPFLWDIDPVQQATRSSYMKNAGSTSFFRAATIKSGSEKNQLVDISMIM